MKDVPPHVEQLILFLLIAVGTALIGAHFHDWKIGTGIYFVLTSSIYLLTKRF